MKKLLIVLLVLFLCGCGQARELKELEVVTAAALAADESGVELAVQLVNQDSALTAYQAESCRYFVGRGENLKAAIADIRAQGAKELTFAHNRLYIIDEEFLATDMVNELITTEPDIRPGAFLVVAAAVSAAELLTGEDDFGVNVSFLLTNVLEEEQAPLLSDFYLALAGEQELALPRFVAAEGGFDAAGSIVIRRAAGGAGD